MMHCWHCFSTHHTSCRPLTCHVLSKRHIECEGCQQQLRQAASAHIEAMDSRRVDSISSKVPAAMQEAAAQELVFAQAHASERLAEAEPQLAKCLSRLTADHMVQGDAPGCVSAVRTTLHSSCRRPSDVQFYCTDSRCYFCIAFYRNGDGVQGRYHCGSTAAAVLPAVDRRSRHRQAWQAAIAPQAAHSTGGRGSRPPPRVSPETTGPGTFRAGSDQWCSVC
jgi:hypothetical protein